MGLHDLTRNREPKARVLAEALIRPIGIKALENAFERVRRDPGTVIIDGDDNAVEGLLSFRLGPSRRPLERDSHDAAGFGKGAGVVNEIGDNLCETGIVPEDKIVRAGVPAPPDRD